MDRLVVVKQVESGQLSQILGARQLGLSTRQLRRIQKRVKLEGAIGIRHRHRGGNRLFSQSFKDETVSLIKKNYGDFGPTLASEKLNERHGIKVSKETARKWMIEEEIWYPKARGKARIHQSRERRPCLGELIQIDGSHHDWFEGRAPKCCLLVLIDDATSTIMHMRFEDSETTLGYLRCFEQYFKQYGRPLAFYSDRHAAFHVTRKTDIQNGRGTQIERALKTLDVELILAKTPQAKGRVERANATLQDRLIKEMRLEGINNIEQANAFLPSFIEKYNRKFSVKPACPQNAHKPMHHNCAQLDKILSVQSNRKLSKNLECSFNNNTMQVINKGNGYRLRGAEVTICQHMNGSISMTHKGLSLEFKITKQRKAKMTVENRKEINAVFNRLWRYPQRPQPQCAPATL